MSTIPLCNKEIARIKYEVWARFPAKWDETAPAICSNLEDEIERALKEAATKKLNK